MSDLNFEDESKANEKCIANKVVEIKSKALSAFENTMLRQSPMIATLSSYLPPSSEYAYMSQLSSASSKFEQSRLIQNKGVYVKNPNLEKCFLASKKFPHAKSITFDLTGQGRGISFLEESESIEWYQNYQLIDIENLIASLQYLPEIFSDLEQLFIRCNFLLIDHHGKFWDELMTIFENFSTLKIWQQLKYLSFTSCEENNHDNKLIQIKTSKKSIKCCSSDKKHYTA